MKQILLLALLSLGLASSAQSVKCLDISWSENGITTNTLYPLTQIKAMTFDANTGSVSITNTLDETTTYTSQQAWTGSFKYSEGGIADIAADNSAVEVWTITGLRVMVAENKSSLNLENLPKGVYIVRESNKTYKITR